MPKSLYGRFLIIFIAPLIIISIIITTVFYHKHWDSLNRSMTSSFSGEVSLIINGIGGIAVDERVEVLKAAKKYMDLDAYIESNTDLDSKGNINEDYELLIKSLYTRITNNLAMFEHDEDNLRLSIQINDDLLNLIFNKKRVGSTTNYIFIMWVIGSAIIMCMISLLFLRGQVRSIVSLAESAEMFGRGQGSEDFKPSGSKEIRGAGVAFIEMKERIKRLLDTRTQMLAGVSHDLKTPLTRMKLSLSMTEDKELANSLNLEIEEMNRMIEGYLKFAQLDTQDHTTEQNQLVDLKKYISVIVAKYNNFQNNITANIPENINVKIKPEYFSRAITNLIDNACKYSENVTIRAQKEDNKFTHIFIDDDGQGISSDKLEDVFQPFFRVDESRNSDTGGVGLGLSITRDVIHKHGGEVKLSESHLGGLRATITLPD